MRKTTATAEPVTHACNCPDCPTQRGGLPRGAYTHNDLMRLATMATSAPDPEREFIKTFPALVEARASCELARMAAEQASKAYLARYVEIEQENLRRAQEAHRGIKPYSVNYAAPSFTKIDRDYDPQLLQAITAQDKANKAVLEANRREAQAYAEARIAWLAHEREGLTDD